MQLFLQNQFTVFLQQTESTSQLSVDHLPFCEINPAFEVCTTVGMHLMMSLILEKGKDLRKKILYGENSSLIVFCF